MDAETLPVLTAGTCAICHEAREHHVTTSCSKPDNPRGHEPVVCLGCFQTYVSSNHTRPLPCPICRAPVSTFRDFRADHLRAPGNTYQTERLFTFHRVPPPATTEQEEVDDSTRPFTFRTATISILRNAPQHRQQNRPPAGNTTMGIFRQQMLHREGIDLNHMVNYRAELDRAHQEILSDAFRTFASQRIYQRLLVTMRMASPMCNILVPELLEHAAQLATHGLCKSCFFPIGFHKRSVVTDQ